MGMRLPSLSEIKQSIELGTTKDWEKFGNRYWSAEKGDLFWSQDPQYGEADNYKSITLTGAQEYHRPESELGVFCINQNPLDIVEATTKESQVIYPESFSTKSGLKFTKILMKDGKPIYVSDRIRPNKVDSWYFARDYAEKLNKEDNCPGCYRLPYLDEIVNLYHNDLWLNSWSLAPYGMTWGNIGLGIYTFDFIHDIIFHPITWQSYVYPISPDDARGGGRALRSANRSVRGIDEDLI